jgi:archaellum component FlaG (FlaF/FlaG flagellin family)
MKKYFLIFATATALVSCDVRRKDKVVDDGSKQMADALKDSTTVQLIDSVYNFGKIAEGEKVEYSFRFKNTGKKPLVVTNASASCGCTVPEKPEKPILPGETGFIKVIFNSKGKSNHQEKAITVSSNVKPFFPELKLVGDVAAPANK